VIPAPIKRFIALFSELPGVGPRQASRFAFWFIKQGPSVTLDYSNALRQLADRIGICRNCFFVFDSSKNQERLCEICSDPKRNRRLLAIVEKETDLITMEKTKSFNGLYHVLGESINPLDENWRKTLRVPELLERLEKSEERVEEILLALPATARGELTAEELTRILAPSGAKITRLGRGLPRGAEIEFADEETLRAAIEHRN
jgi:recombination protein RecR